MAYRVLPSDFFKVKEGRAVVARKMWEEALCSRVRNCYLTFDSPIRSTLGRTKEERT